MPVSPLRTPMVRSDDDIFWKNSAKCTNFEVSNLGIELQVLSLGLGVFDEVSISSRNFNQVSVSVSKVMVSTTSLPNTIKSKSSKDEHLFDCIEILQIFSIAMDLDWIWNLSILLNRIWI